MVRLTAVLLVWILATVLAIPVHFYDAPDTDQSSADNQVNADIPGENLSKDKQDTTLTSPFQKWPGGLVPFVISEDFPLSVKTTILAAMREIEDDVNNPLALCIQFFPRSSEKNFIEIFPGNGCHSTIGMVNQGRQEVSIGEGCEAKGIIMHELLHALGFWHEQTRHDRDNFIDINFSNVESDQQADFTKVPAFKVLSKIPYDFESIMHYGPYTLAKDKSTPVIVPKAGQANGLKMGQRLALSKLDVLKIQEIYECQTDTSHIARSEEADHLMNCGFDDGICNLSHVMTSTLYWTTQRGASQEGPRAGNSNGEDAYMVAVSTNNTGVASIVTPFFSNGSACLDFFHFQRGPTSYLEVLAQGPRISRVTIRSFKGINQNRWAHSRVSVSVPEGVHFQIFFEAHMDSGDVAIDDLSIYSGECL